jgi:hypothetical protein
MSRYFFNLKLAGVKTIPDTDGQDFASLDAVKAAAIQVAQDIAHNKSPPEIDGLYISITDESGKEVFRTPLR